MGRREISKMLFRVAICVVMFAFLAEALPSIEFRTRVSLEPVARVPAGWTLQSPAAPDENVTLYFFLRHAPGAEAKLTSELMAVSDPRSSRYGQHLTNEELRSLLFVE